MFNKILIASDGSDDALHATHLTGLIACATNAELIVVNAFNLSAAIAFLAPDAISCTQVVIESGEATQKDVLRRTREILLKGGITCQTRAEIGHPVESTLRVAEEEAVDLIAIGSHGLSGFAKLVLGGVADGIAHHATCPVLIVRGKTDGIHQILVAVDGSELAYRALEKVSDMARSLRATITILHVLDQTKPFPGIASHERDTAGYALLIRTAVIACVDKILKETGIVYRVWQEKGHPVEVITDFATKHHSDLIVMGSHGLGTFQRLLLGSVSYAVLHHAHCPVLIVR